MNVSRTTIIQFCENHFKINGSAEKNSALELINYNEH